MENKNEVVVDPKKAKNHRKTILFISFGILVLIVLAFIFVFSQP